jgi:hypothetical protein
MAVWMFDRRSENGVCKKGGKHEVSAWAFGGEVGEEIENWRGTSLPAYEFLRRSA